MAAESKAVSVSHRLVSVQLCRGIAALAVVLSHLRNVESKYFRTRMMIPFRHGCLGVDLFFVLSGLIILRSSANKFGKRRYPLTFLKKRLLRVLPTYWVYTAVCLCLFIYNPSTMNASSGHHANIVSSFLLHPGYDPLLLSQAWTLIYELYYYLVIAVLLCLPNRRLALQLLTLLTVVCVGSRLLVPPPTATVSVITSPYNLEFLAGALLSRLEYLLRGRLRLAVALIACSGVWLLAGTVGFTSFLGSAGLDWIELSRWWRPAIYGGASLLFLAGMLSLEGTPTLDRFRSFEAIGDWSYSMYLSHIFVIEAVGRIVAREIPPMRSQILLVDGVSLAAALWVSALSHRHVESRVGRIAFWKRLLQWERRVVLEINSAARVPWLLDFAASRERYVLGEE